MSLRISIFRSALLGLFASLFVSFAGAQTELSGSVSDDTTGQLLSGQVYHLNNQVTVPAGKTLTVQAGAIIKGRTSSHLLVHGTLLVNGTPGNDVVMTSILDDVGGDTGGDGATAGAAGNWRGVYMYSTSGASQLSNVDLRYAGNGGYAGVDCLASGVLFDNVTISACSGDGINMNNKVNTVVGCHFTGLGGVPVDTVPLQSMPFFNSNTATVNAGGNFVRVTTFTHTADVTVTPSNCIDGVLVLQLSQLNVAAIHKLTFDQGLIVKMGMATHILTHGTLDVLGTELEPVVLTTLADDSVGGDTGNDGLSSGVPGSWRGLYFYSTSDASRVEHTEIKYAGNSGYGAVTTINATINIDNCLIRQCSDDAIDLSGGSVGITITNNVLQNNAKLPINNVPLQALPFFSNNTAVGNADGDYIRSTSFTHATDVEIDLDNLINGQVVYTGTSVNVAAGRRLTLGAGMIFKMTAATHFLVQGILDIPGVSGSPVVFTPVADDAYGGDTLKDGATAGTPGAWRGFYFYVGGTASTVDFAILRYTGNGGYAGISLDTSPPLSITNSIIQHGSDDAIYQLSGPGGAVVAGCSFLDNAGIAANNVSVNALVHFRDNITLGNAGGNHTVIANPNPVGDVILKQENVIGDLLYLSSGTSITSPHSLTFEEGMILKIRNGMHLQVHTGEMNLLGTEEDPIIMTSFQDDSVVGDSNLGGSPPAAGDWRGFYLHAGAQFTARHVKMSYVGNGGYPGIHVGGPAAVLDHVDVRHALWNGFDIAANLTTDPTHLTAFDCGRRGIHLLNGSCRIRRSTVANCGMEGILRMPAFTGRVADSISYGNTLANFSGFGPGALSYSNGSATHAGTKGNIDADPLFVDQSGGDLRPMITSPCVDKANPQSMTDPDGSRADMGSYYFDFSGPTKYCAAKVSSLGCTPAIDFAGLPTLGGTDDFHVTATNIVGQQPGYLLSSLKFNSGSKNGLGASLLGTNLCAYNPKLLVSTNSGGTVGLCDGTFDVHFSQAMMASEGLLIGQTVYTQYVYKDPAHLDGSGWGHTDGLRFQVAP